MDVTTLGIKVKSDGIENTNRGLDKLERNSKGASSATAKLKKNLSSLKGALTAIGIAAGAATAMGYLAKRNLDAADKIAKTADSLNITTDALQKYQYIAERVGVGSEALTSSFKRVSARISLIGSESGELYSRLKDTNKELLDQIKNAKGNAEAIDIVMGAMRNATSETDKMRLAAAAFGNTNAAVMTQMAQDTKALEDRYKELGLQIDEELLRGAESAKDAIDDLGAVIGTSFTKVVLELAPQIEKAASGMADWVAENKEFISQDIPEAVEAIGKAAVWAIDQVVDLNHEMQGTAHAWEKFRSGDIGFFEWATMGADEAYNAKKSLEEMTTSFEELANGMQKTAAETKTTEAAVQSLNVGALSKSVSLIKQQVPALQETIAAWDQHIATLQGKYSSTLDKIAQQEQGLMNIRRSNNDMIRELENKNLPATVRYYDEVRALERQTAEASKMSGDAKVQELQRINQEWFNLSGAVRENGEEVISQEEATGRALAEIRENAAAMEEAKQAGIDASKEQLANLSTSIADAEAQVAQYRKELDALQQQTADLAQTTQVNIDTGQATSAVQKLNGELQKLLSSMAQAEGTQYAQPPESGDFASGGYTGRGGVNQPAGIVHKGEVVFSQSDVARAGGVAAVESMRRSGDLPGYAGGGIAGYVGNQYNAIDQELQGYQTYDELITSDFSRRLQSFREHALRWYSAANQAQLMYAEQQYRGRMNELYNQQEAAQSITQNTGDQSTNYNVTVNSSANSGETLARELLPAIQKLQQRRITIE